MIGRLIPLKEAQKHKSVDCSALEYNNNRHVLIGDDWWWWYLDTQKGESHHVSQQHKANKRDAWGSHNTLKDASTIPKHLKPYQDRYVSQWALASIHHPFVSISYKSTDVIIMTITYNGMIKTNHFHNMKKSLSNTRVIIYNVACCKVHDHQGVRTSTGIFMGDYHHLIIGCMFKPWNISLTKVCSWHQATTLHMSWHGIFSANPTLHAAKVVWNPG